MYTSPRAALEQGANQLTTGANFLPGDLLRAIRIRGARDKLMDVEIDVVTQAPSGALRDQLLIEEYRSLRAQLDYQIAASVVFQTAS